MKNIFLIALIFLSVNSFCQMPKIYGDTSLNSNTPYGVNANLKTSANYFNKGAAFNNFSFAYGTSITIGLYAENYYTDVQRQLGNTVFANYAVSSCAERTAIKNWAANQGTKLQGASIGDPAFNMSRWAFNNPLLDSTHLFAEMKAGARWLTAAQFADTLQFYRVLAGTVNPNVTTSQSALTALALDTLKDLGSRSVFFGTNSWWKQSITANETYTNMNVKGKNLIIGVWADSVGGSRIQYAVDGVTIGTYDPNNRCNTYDLDAPTGFHRLGIINDVIVIYTGKDSLHTVVLTFLDGGKFGGVDFIGNMKEPSVASFAPIYVMDVQHMNSTGYAVTGGSSVVQDSASNSRWQDQQNTFPNYVGSAAIIRVNVNVSAGGHYDPNDAAQINSDGIHPMGPGYRNMAIDVLAACNPKSNPTTLFVPGLNQQLLYNNNGILGASGIYWDGTHLTIGNGGTATDDISVRHDQSGNTMFRSWNGSSSGQAGYQAVNDGIQSVSLRIKGSAAGAYGSYVNNSGGLYSNSGAGMMFMQDNAQDIWWAAGSGAPAQERMRLKGSNGDVLIGTSTDDASLLLNISSTTKGFAPPRMTTAQRNAISSPTAGNHIYCTDCTATDASTGVDQTYNGSTWKNSW